MDPPTNYVAYIYVSKFMYLCSAAQVNFKFRNQERLTYILLTNVFYSGMELCVSHGSYKLPKRSRIASGECKLHHQVELFYHMIQSQVNTYKLLYRDPKLKTILRTKSKLFPVALLLEWFYFSANILS